MQFHELISLFKQFETYIVLVRFSHTAILRVSSVVGFCNGLVNFLECSMHWSIFKKMIKILVHTQILQNFLAHESFTDTTSHYWNWIIDRWGYGRFNLFAYSKRFRFIKQKFRHFWIFRWKAVQLIVHAFSWKIITTESFGTFSAQNKILQLQLGGR